MMRTDAMTTLRVDASPTPSVPRLVVPSSRTTAMRSRGDGLQGGGMMSDRRCSERRSKYSRQDMPDTAVSAHAPEMPQKSIDREGGIAIIGRDA
jgi:hypothetical protein